MSTCRTILCCSVLLITVPSAVHAAPAQRPNIVIFLSDDMGWGQPGFQGGKDVATPNLDRIAREGVRLTQFYACSVCSPTRAALMTGRYPFRNGMEERSHGNDTAGMLTDERTLADTLRQAGYFTAIIGKWHLGNWQKKHLPLQRGFDHQYGHYGALIDSFTHQRDAVFDWHRNEQPLDEPGYSTFLIADEFSRVLDMQKPDRPFFIYVPFNAVHGPHGAPQEYVDKHHGNKQHAILECMDVGVGRMLSALEQRGVLDNTLVIFFNDNGGPKGSGGNAPYRGYKGETYEGGVRVPCAMRWPGRIPAGGDVNEMLHVVDLFPTLVKLAGRSLDQPLPLDGIDAWATISQGQPSPRSEIVLSASNFAKSETGPPALRSGDFKLVGDQLFNVREDPYETTDLASQYPDRVRTLRERLDTLSSARRTPEDHGPLPNFPVAIYGEEENKPPLPEWLKTLAEKNRDAAGPAKGNRKGRRQAAKGA
ncbi:MAG TPA: arylsulfatase [Pirellulales bacterium]|nr:arylsulfatase [Pirellulales bacterium]